jgi:general secretion pathway protein L
MASSADFASIRARSSRERLSAFWRWWTQELRQLVPARFSMLGGVGRVPVVSITGGEVALVDARGVSPSASTRIAMDTLDPVAQRAALRQLLEIAGETGSRVRLRLDRGEALVRRVSLPAATEENLEQVLGFEMDRLTPFRADDVYFDHRIVSRDAASGQVQVELAVARRELVDSKLDRLRAWGGSIQGVTIPEEPAAGAQALDLLPRELRGQRESGRDRWLVPALAALVLALFAIALLLPVYKKREAVVAMMPQVAKAKQEAEATDVIRAQLERQVSDYNFLMTRKQGTWPVLAFIEEVSKLLPDHTWVQQLDVKTLGKTREVQVTGETASSSKLIEIFEQSTVLQNAQPRGTVTRGSTPASERFMIVAEARPRTPPPSKPLLEVVEALPTAPPPASAPPPAAAAAETPAPPVAAPPVATVKPSREPPPPAPTRPSR